jgi:uncharacterized membrane protein required for colicin V production
MIDWIALGLIAVAAIFGFIRGIVSQIVALAGLVAAYSFAPALGRSAGPWIQHQLGCSLFIAEKAGTLLIGITIYIAFRMVGFVFEKMFVRHVRDARLMNRVGGAVLGGLKGTLLVGLFFCFVALVPRENVIALTPKLTESVAYRWAAEHNPMVQQDVLERMRRLRTVMKDPKKADHLQNSKELERLLERYNLKGALKEDRVLAPLQEGNYTALQRNEQIEKLMRDEELTKLLVDLESAPTKN